MQNEIESLISSHYTNRKVARFKFYVHTVKIYGDLELFPGYLSFVMLVNAKSGKVGHSYFER